MSNHSVIEHRANYHYFKMEEDYVRICGFGKQYPQCKAAILAILEHWINDKRAKGQDEHIYMTYPEWVDAMYGLFRRNTIIACLAELVQEKFISRRECVRHGKETYEYTLNIRLVQERLKLLEERDDKNCRPNLNASKFKRQQPTHLNLNGSTHPNLDGTSSEASKNKRIIYSDNIDSSSHIDSSLGANAPTPAHDLKEKVRQLLDSDPRLKAITTEMVAQAEEDEAPTVKMKAVKPSKHTTTPEPHDDVAQAGPPAGDSFPASSGGPRRSEASVIPSRKRAYSKKSVTMPEPAPKFDLTSEQQSFWSLWCGVWFNQDIPPEITETAYKHVVKLAPHITTAELLSSLIDYTRKELQESQGIRRKAVQLGNCVNSYRGWKQVQREEPPPQSEQEVDEDYSDPEGFDRYVGNGKEERAARLKLYAEMKARGELVV